MPPKKPVRRASRASIGQKNELMGPPPAPVTQGQTSTSHVKTEPGQNEDPILEPEVKALRECLIDSATTMAQLVNHYTDVHKVGVERHASYPPRGLRESWIKQAERYDDIVDAIEIQVQRALAAVEWQIEQEAEKVRQKEAEELLRKGAAAAAGKGKRPMSLSIPIPKFDEKHIDPLSVHPDLNISSNSPTLQREDTIMQDGQSLSEETMEIDQAKAVPSGAAVPKDSSLSRTSRSSISLTSLNRHGLKLDLSNLSLEGLETAKSALAASRTSALGGPPITGIDGIHSPSTLAPKSARPRAGIDGEFPDLALLHPFLKSAMDGIQIPPGLGDSSAAPIDISGAGDISMDLFGDNEMDFSGGAGGVGTMTANAGDSLFSPDDMLPIKGEEMPIDLTGGDTAAGLSNEDKILEELGYVEVNPNAIASTSAAPVTDLNLESVMESFNLPDASTTQPDANGDTTFDFMQLNLPDNTQQSTDQPELSFADLGFDMFATSSNPGDPDLSAFFQNTDNSKTTQ